MVAGDCAEIADDRQTDRKRREEALQSGKLEKTKQKSNQRGRICTAVKRAVAAQKKTSDLRNIACRNVDCVIRESHGASEMVIVSESELRQL